MSLKILMQNPYFKRGTEGIRDNVSQEAVAEEINKQISHLEAEAQPKRLPARPWHGVPLIEMLPADRRAEAVGVLAQNPDAIQVLRFCKCGLFDCWEAMRRLGMDPEPLEAATEDYPQGSESVTAIAA